LIHISQLSLLIFTGYPWHGVQLFIGLTLFGFEALLFFYLYHIISWAGNLRDESRSIEKLIEEIGSDKEPVSKA
ncbi:MAG: hypothetical protein KDD99_16690, partial [Bacteroidetes bacterium]|nr:hypothetical protein [Bacteroidota bacterium]